MRNRTTIWSNMILLGHTFKKKKNEKDSNLKRYMPPMFIAALFIILWCQGSNLCLLTGKWIKKMWYISIFNELLLKHKNEWNFPICNNTGGSRVRQKNTVWCHLYESLKQVNITKMKETYRYRTNWSSLPERVS